MSSIAGPIVSVSSILLLSSLLGGCAAPVASSSESTASSESAITIVPSPLPPIVFYDPLVYCTGIPASRSITYANTSGPFFPNMGDSGPLSSTCDFYVWEITNTLGNWVSAPITATPPIPGTPPPGQSPYALPPVVPDANDCTASYFTYETMGFLPPRIVFNGVTFEEIPGKWVEIGSGTQDGEWNATTGKCVFQKIEQTQGPFYPFQFSGLEGTSHTTTGSPYSQIRIATRFWLSEPSGGGFAPLYMYVN